MRRWLDIVGRFLWGVIAVVVLAAVVLVIAYTQTNWGRTQVLAFGLRQLADRVHGYVYIRRLHGNLLTGARLEGVVITDSAGRPFLAADTLELRYSLRSLLAKHLVLSDVDLINGTVVLDRPPHDEWNFSRIFPTTPKKKGQKPGFGSWVLIQDMTVRHSTFMVRNEWAPSDSLHGAARDSAIAAALAPTNRQWIVPVPGGWQSLAVFGNVNAFLPVMRVADPDSATRLIDIFRLSTIGFPFRPPAVLVNDLHARVVITKDSLLFDSVGILLPGTHAGGRGGYALNGEGAHVELAMRPVSFPDVRFLYPDAPVGGGHGGLAFNSHKGRVHVIGSDLDLWAEGAVVTGLADFQVGRSFFRVGPSDVAYANVSTRLIRQFAPRAPLKVAGSFDGVARLAGVPGSMKADAWTRFQEVGGPTSIVTANGIVGAGPDGFRARDLRLGFQPLYLSVVRGYSPQLPYHGRVTGDATLTGSSAQGFTLAANLVDDDPTAGRSHLLAQGGLAPRNGVTAHDLTLRFDPLQVALLRPLVKKLPYGGTITGSTTLNGSPRTRLDLAADLVHRSAATGRSHVMANGGIQIAGGLAARGLRLRFAPLQVALVRPFDPRLPYGGTLTGTAALTGSTRGLSIAADVTHVDPAYGRSHVTAHGFVRTAGGFAARDLRLGFAPLQVEAIKALAPKIPYAGVIDGHATLSGSLRGGFDVAADLTHVDPTIGRSHVTANGFVRTTGGFAARDLRLGFLPLQVAAIKPFAPKIPYAGVLSGNTTLSGSSASGFDVVADLTHVDPAIGNSHVTANGFVRLAGGLATRGLRLGLEPLQLAAVRPFVPSLRVDGTLAGQADVTASLAAKQVAATLDLQHWGSTGYSHVLGTAKADWRSPGSFDVNLRAPALSLATAGTFFPSAGLHGAASGDIVASGNLANLTTDLNLAIANGGAFDLRGAFDLAAAQKRYDFTSHFSEFNAGAVTTRAPTTSLNGTVVAQGVGTDPATATASLVANLVDSRAAGSPQVDTALVNARVAGGLATFDQGHVRLGSTLADVRGSFGLIAARSGTLAYYLRTDSIGQFASHLPRTDTGTVRPRPLLVQRRIAQARLDSARIDSVTLVQRMAVGYPPPPQLRPDTAPVRRDTLAGSLVAQGTATGNIKVFNASGTAQARNFTAGAEHIGAGAASYTILGYGTPNPFVHVIAFADTADLGGFAFDSVRALVDYNGLSARGRGRADVAAYQDSRRAYRVSSAFDLSLPQKRLDLQSVYLRFDTTTWTSTAPASIRWGSPGVVVSNLDLRSSNGGYLQANGRLPSSGAADLRVDAEGVQVGDITALLQDTMSLRGRAALHARVQGTTRAPVIAGTAALTLARWGGRFFPDARAQVNYANTELRANGQLLEGPTLLALVNAQLPINLALSGVTGPRLIRTGPLSVDLRADSLPLQMLPDFTPAVSDVTGIMRGNVAVRGTWQHTSVNGVADLRLGSLRVSSSGVLYNDIAGEVRLRGDSAYVDSLVAHAGGTVRVNGAIDLASLARPSFNLAIASSDAYLLDDKYGRIRADSHLTARGPYAHLHVRGTATITGGVIYAPEMNTRHATNLEDPTLAGALRASGAPPSVLPPPNPFLQGLDVNVALRVQPDTWVRNSQANFEVYTPPDEDLRVHMDNPRQTLTLLGTIDSDRGDYTYAGRVFQLSTGSATFMGGPRIDPLLQASAIYTVERQGQEALPIQIDLSGTLSAPRVTLQSNAQPPLSQSDLLSYLAFGQPTSSVLTLQGSPTLTPGGQGSFDGIPALVEQQTASLALGAVVDQWVKDIQTQGTRAGLDVFRVSPGELPAEAAFQGYFQNVLTGTQFEAGKYLNPRFFVEARGRMNTFPGLLLQYRELNGLQWLASWEPRYLPIEPSFSTTTLATQRRALSTLLLWTKRF